MKYAVCFWGVLFLVGLSCSEPTTVKVGPNPLVLEGKGTKGKLVSKVFDKDGKEITADFPVTWMCLDDETIRITQDGEVQAVKSGKALVDVEVVGSEVPGVPGTAIHGMATVIVRIPGWLEMSHEEVHLELGSKETVVWAELRNDRNHPMAGYLPLWKVDNPNIVSIESYPSNTETRMLLKLTPRAVGETFVSALYDDLAGDILITVSEPPKDTDTELTDSNGAFVNAKN